MIHMKTLFTVKLASDKLPAGLACGLGDDDGEFLAVHEGNDVGKITLERGRNGVVLLVAADDGKDGLFCALGVHVGVERPRINRDALAVLKVFDVQALCAGELVHNFLALVDIGNVGVDDVHIYFPFWPIIFSTGRPSPIDKPLSGLFRHIVKFVRHFNPCAVS